MLTGTILTSGTTPKKTKTDKRKEKMPAKSHCKCIMDLQ